MNILVEDATQQIKYADYEFRQYTNGTVASREGEITFIIKDLNITNSSVYIVTSVPADFIGGKYLYLDGGLIEPNPDFIDPDFGVYTMGDHRMEITGSNIGTLLQSEGFNQTFGEVELSTTVNLETESMLTVSGDMRPGFYILKRPRGWWANHLNQRVGIRYVDYQINQWGEQEKTYSIGPSFYCRLADLSESEETRAFRTNKRITHKLITGPYEQFNTADAIEVEGKEFNIVEIKDHHDLTKLVYRTLFIERVQ